MPHVRKPHFLVVHYLAIFISIAILVAIVIMFPLLPVAQCYICRKRLVHRHLSVGKHLMSSFSSSVHVNENVPVEAPVDFSRDMLQHRLCIPQLSNTKTLEQLVRFCDIISEWNAKINVISRKDILKIVDNHLLPSLAITKVVPSFCNGLRAIDVGTGGGFPGIPLAIMFPNSQFTLLDSNGKKITVVRDAVDKLQLNNVRVVYGRSEDHTEKYEVVIGRAVSALPSFIGFTKHLLCKTAAVSSPSEPGLLYIKGGVFEDELSAAGIKNYMLHPIDQLIKGLATDKKLLVVDRKQFFDAKI